MDWQKFIELFQNCEIIGNKMYVRYNLRDVIEFVSLNYDFDMLKQIIATDIGDEHTELVYHLYSTMDDEDLFISVVTAGEVETITNIFPSAIFDENEIYDLFGINFVGNTELKRLYMPEGWKGYPLKKDYFEERIDWNE